MKPYPHHYRVGASAAPEGLVILASEGLEALDTAPPLEFDGPGDCWSPETLLIGAVADCFALTFRAIAKASSFPWKGLQVLASGTLERVDGGPRFSAVQVEATLLVSPDVEPERARRLLEKAERGCLITRSLVCDSTLVSRVEVSGTET